MLVVFLCVSVGRLVWLSVCQMVSLPVHVISSFQARETNHSSIKTHHKIIIRDYVSDTACSSGGGEKEVEGKGEDGWMMLLWVVKSKRKIMNSKIVAYYD